MADAIRLVHAPLEVQPQDHRFVKPTSMWGFGVPGVLTITRIDPIGAFLNVPG